MITYKCNDGRLGENISFLYGLFRFAKINNIPFDNICIDLNYKNIPLIRNEEPSFVFKENLNMFKNIDYIFKENIDYNDYFTIDLNGKYDIGQLYNFYRYNNIDKKSNIIFKGYWSLSWYFIKNDTHFDIKLLDYICRPRVLLEDIRKKYKDILNKSVAIHIRKKDFNIIDNKELLNNNLNYDIYYNNEKKNYSREDISSIISNIKRTNIFSNILIFSDDIEWCKNNLHFDYLHYIEGNEPYKDMILMSLCNYIIPNPGSFFSLIPSIFNKFKL